MKNNKNNKQDRLQVVVMGPSKDFELIKKIDENGVEYWTARELMGVLGYPRWESFDEVVSRAIRSALNSNQTPEDHFRQLTKMVKLGSNSVRKVNDWKLDRYACYLIAQNGDSTKPQIASAQTYFSVQTRKQEILDGLSETKRRIAIRDGIVAENSKLFFTAKAAGVSRFGAFDDAGYQGLYNVSLSEVEKRKKIKKGELMSRASSEELGANMFRITQTEAKLKREDVKGDLQAQNMHFKVGSKIRQTLKDLGSEMPENLKPKKYTRQLKNTVKRLGTARKTLK